jgi:hypothetical protein
VKTSPPCATCEYGRPPALDAGNAEAWELWKAVQTQWRAAGFGVIGLDYGVLIRLAELMRIEWTPALLKKIQALEDAVLASVNRKPDT